MKTTIITIVSILCASSCTCTTDLAKRLQKSERINALAAEIIERNNIYDADSGDTMSDYMDAVSDYDHTYHK